MKLRNLWILLVLACAWLLPSAVIAQDSNEDNLTGGKLKRFREKVPSYNLQFWRPAPNPGDYLTTYGSMIDKEHWRVTGGLYFNYAHIPMDESVENERATKAVIANPIFMDIYASISLFSWAEIALDLPVLLYEQTDFKAKEYPLHKANGVAGVGDLRIVVKGKILDLRDYPVGLALIADLSTPTAQDNRLIGDDGVSFAIRAALEFSPWTKARMSFNLGYRYRPHVNVYTYDMGQSIIISGAASIPFFHDDLDLLLDMTGEITVDGKNNNLSVKERPFEADLAFRYRFIRGDSWYRGLALTAGLGTGLNSVGAPDVRVILGLNFHWVNGGMLGLDYEYGGYLTAIDPCPDPELTPLSQIPERCRNQLVDSDGDTIPDKFDRCPFAGRPGFIDEYGCPPDSDNDTVPDYLDLCPNEGGRVDKNGCPIKPLDSDGDTIIDDIDQCPYEPETFNGYQDEDGCPDSDPDAKVELAEGKINIKEQVFFETSKAVIKSESFDLLNQVAQLLIDNPHIGNVTVEGHTDSRGKYKLNMKLSQDRADSVMRYLVERGVDANHLNAIGYGPDRPIETNDTKEGRAKNRRVEFVVLGLPDTAQTPESAE